MFWNDLKDMGKRISVPLLLAVLLVIPFFRPAVADGRVPTPKRIVSLNVCTDQLLMMLVPRTRIAAVSYVAQSPEASVMYEQARDIPITTGGAEDVILFKPDLVVAGTFSTRATVHLLRKLGARLIELSPASNFDDIIENIRTLGRAVGEADKAERLVARLQADLAEQDRYPQTANQSVVAPYYANGYSAGKNTLVDAILSRAGYVSLGQKLNFVGTRKLNLETLILEKPDALLLGHKSYTGNALAYEIFRHPVLRHLNEKTRSLSIADTLTICGTPHTVGAVRQLRNVTKTADTQDQTDFRLVQRGPSKEGE